MRRLLVALGALVAVVLVAEGAARTLAPYLPEPQLYGDRATQVKAAQLDGLADSCVSLVLAGNSMGRDAFDPRLFTDADPGGRSAYNASLDAASPALLRRWLLDEVEPALRPDTVVLTLASLDLNVEARAARSALAAYDTADLTRDDPLGRLQVPLLDHVALVRHRDALRDPAEVWDALARLRDGEPTARTDANGEDGLIGPRGEGLSRRELRYRSDPAGASLVRTQLLNDFTLGDGPAEDLGALLDGLANRGVEVAVVLLPVTPEYVSLHPAGRADLAAFAEQVSRVSGSRGVPVIDLLDAGWDGSLFADTHHLNGIGAERFSAELPALLADAGLDGTARRC
jgi:hypothetical protein